MSNPPDIFRTSLPSAFDASLGERRMRALPARSVPTASTYSSSSLVSALPLPNNTYPNSLGMVRSSTSMDLVPSGNGSFQSASSLSFEASPQPPGSLEWSVGAKRDADDGRETKPERPTKKRRGLTGVLVDGAVTASIVAGAAVFGAYSLWQSWGRKPQEVYEHPSLIEDACTDFLPNTSMVRAPFLFALSPAAWKLTFVLCGTAWYIAVWYTGCFALAHGCFATTPRTCRVHLESPKADYHPIAATTLATLTFNTPEASYQHALPPTCIKPGPNRLYAQPCSQPDQLGRSPCSSH